MGVITRSSHLEVQSSYEQSFKELSLEELWSHPKLQPFKTKRNREILTLELGKNTFFVKRYHGPGVGLAKYVLRGFRDKYGPENEWQKAHFLKKLGIRGVEPVAFGIERRCGIIRRAILVTLKLEGDRLEDLLREETDLNLKTNVIDRLAAFTGHFHASGLSHQDFYLCHLFWSPQSEKIGLIDLQRIRYHRGQNGQPRLSWVVKDLAQLDYSSRKVLSTYEYTWLKERFLSVYRRYFPLIAESRVAIKISRKVVRIARHDRKIQAKENGRTQ